MTALQAFFQIRSQGRMIFRNGNTHAHFS
jgi:hypothetical protein